MRTLRGVGLIIATAAAAGCGQASSTAVDFEGDQAKVAEAVEALQEAAERREHAEICRDLVTRSLRDALARGGSSCDSEMKKAVEDSDSRGLEVRKVTITGPKATAVVLGDAGEKDTMRTFELALEAGRWRVSSFGG